MSDGRHISDRELVQSIDGELSDRRRLVVDAHVAVCEPCRARRQTFEQTLGHVADSYRQGFTRPNLEARTRLQVSLSEMSSEMDRSWTVRLLPPVAALRWGAVCGAAVAAALLLSSRAPSTPVREATGATIVEPHALPIVSLTPGAVRTARADELCRERHPHEPPTVPVQVARQVLHAYGMDDEPLDAFELDYLITPELGGAVDASNLWPQPYQKQPWNAFVKDELERLLPDLVCSGRVSLEVAQRDIATDWIAAYRKYFKTRDPLSNAFGLSRKLS